MTGGSFSLWVWGVSRPCALQWWSVVERLDKLENLAVFCSDFTKQNGRFGGVRVAFERRPCREG